MYCEKNRISKKYKLPIISIRQILENAKNEKSEFGESIRKELEEIKQQQIAEMSMQAKKKKQKFNPETAQIIPRFTSEMLVKVYNKKLNERVCLNKGFILDGFPKIAPEAQKLFLEDNKHNKFMPNRVILIESPEEIIRNKAAQMPEEEKIGTHYDEEGINRRISEYNQRNDGSQGYPSLAEFFRQNGIEVLKISTEGLEEENTKAIIDYIEKVSIFI